MKIIGKTIVHLGKKYTAISEYENIVRAETQEKGKTHTVVFKRPMFLEKLSIKPVPKKVDPAIEALERDLAIFEKSQKNKKEDAQSLLEKMKSIVANAQKQVKKLEAKVQNIKEGHKDFLHKAYNLDLVKKADVPVEDLQSFDNSNLKGIMKSYKITSTVVQKGGVDYKEDLNLFRKDVSDKVKSVMKYALETNAIKVSLRLDCTFRFPNDHGKKFIAVKAGFWSANKNVAPVILNKSNIKSSYEIMMGRISGLIEDFIKRGSGMVFEHVDQLYVNLYRYSPMKPKSYIELPAWIKVKKCCVNVKNIDNECFRWAILSALYPVLKNTERVTCYASKYNRVNFSGEFPVA
jgi:hypothetical protein